MRKRNIAAGTVVIGVGLTVGIAGLANKSQSNDLPKDKGVVERVIDGDTIVVQINGSSETIRLIGIDTPETVKKGTPVQCFGPEASEFTKKQLPQGSIVRLTRDVEARDRYDRLLAYVYRDSDDMFINLELIRLGYATALRFPPNTTFADNFASAANAASDDQLGLWGACKQGAE